MPSEASAFARLFRRVTNSETGRSEASFRNGRPVERKLLMEQVSKAVSGLGAESPWDGEGKRRRGCCESCSRAS